MYIIWKYVISILFLHVHSLGFFVIDFTLPSLPNSVYTEVSDGKGGKIKIKKAGPGKKGGKGAAGRKGGGKGGKDDPIFSDATTDDDDVDLENMTEEEKKAYFEGKAKRAAEREKRRREKYGDKYEEMMAQHQEFVLYIWLMHNLLLY